MVLVQKKALSAVFEKATQVICVRAYFTCQETPIVHSDKISSVIFCSKVEYAYLMDESRARTCVNFSTTTNSNKYLDVYTFEYSRVNGNAREFATYVKTHSLELMGFCYV